MVKCSDGGKKLMVQVFGPSYADSEIKYTYKRHMAGKSPSFGYTGNFQTSSGIYFKSLS